MQRVLKQPLPREYVYSNEVLDVLRRDTGNRLVGARHLNEPNRRLALFKVSDGWRWLSLDATLPGVGLYKLENDKAWHSIEAAVEVALDEGYRVGLYVGPEEFLQLQKEGGYHG